MTAVKSSGAGSSKSVKSTALAEDAVEPHPGPAPESTAARTQWWGWLILAVVGLAQSVAAAAFIIGLFWFCGWGMS